jgi:hypothetical protein
MRAWQVSHDSFEDFMAFITTTIYHTIAVRCPFSPLLTRP